MEKPYVYDRYTLKDIVHEMVDDINEHMAESDENFLEMEYILGHTQGYDVKVVITKKVGGSGIALTKESIIPYVDEA